MCPLSDQNDFWIGHHIREKPCGALFLWTRGHTVVCREFRNIQSFPRVKYENYDQGGDKIFTRVDMAEHKFGAYLAMKV